MILSEKIITHRKENNLSQEELAYQLGVSRQSVSKWENGQSIPDLDKILKLSEIFSVSTDYLLKDDIEESLSDNIEERVERKNLTKVTLEDANIYMELERKNSKIIALAIFLFIVSPIPLFLNMGFNPSLLDGKDQSFSEFMGLAILLIVVAIGVAIIIITSSKMEKYQHFENNFLDLEYGVAGIIEKKKEVFRPIHARFIALSIALFITSEIPLFIATYTYSDKELESKIFFALSFTLLLFAIGVFILISSNIIMRSYDKLLEEGDYTREQKEENKKNALIASIYWSIMTVIYLGVSFLTERWDITWVIWPVAGIMYSAIITILAIKRKKA